MSLSIATGMSWCRRAVRRGVVLYVLTEGAAGLPLRLRAWLLEVPDEACAAADGHFFCLPSAVQVLEGEITELIAAIDALGITPVLIIIDTLARCFAGGDENTAKDMAQFVRGCDQLRERYAATVLVVHHSRKGSTSERGSSVLRGAVDSMFATERERGSKIIKVTCEKQKDAEEFRPLYFELRTEWFGKDRERVLTGCRLVPTDPPADDEGGEAQAKVSGSAEESAGQPLDPVPPRERTARERVLEVLHSPEAAAGVSVAQLLAVIDRGRSTINEALRRLVVAKVAEHDEERGLYFLAGRRPQPPSNDAPAGVRDVSGDCPGRTTTGQASEDAPLECPVRVRSGAPPLKGAPGAGPDTGRTTGPDEEVQAPRKQKKRGSRPPRVGSKVEPTAAADVGPAPSEPAQEDQPDA